MITTGYQLLKALKAIEKEKGDQSTGPLFKTWRCIFCDLFNSPSYRAPHPEQFHSSIAAKRELCGVFSLPPAESQYLWKLLTLPQNIENVFGESFYLTQRLKTWNHKAFVFTFFFLFFIHIMQSLQRKRSDSPHRRSLKTHYCRPTNGDPHFKVIWQATRIKNDFHNVFLKHLISKRYHCQQRLSYKDMLVNLFS